jgi:signal transduction histidine kinase
VLVGCALIEPPEEEVVGFVLDLTQRKHAEAEAREQKEQLQEMSSELMMAEERERRRIATVLHDAVVQMLALSKMKLDTLRRETPDEPVQRRLGEIYELIDRSIVHTRNLTAQLSPPVLYELGLSAAIQWLGDRIREDHGISFTLRDDRRPKPISDETRIALFQSVRELLMNVVKHARARRCEVEVRCVDSELRIVITDDGCGFSPRSPVDYSRGGFGLFSIRQRLAHLGGCLEIISEPGAGCRAIIYAPLITQGDKHEHQDFVGRRSSAGAPGPAQHA